MQDSTRKSQGGESTNSKRKKNRKSDTPSLMDNAFMELEIRKFCPKKIFDIILLNASEEESEETLKNIIESAKDYEEVTCVTFIKYDDVLAVLDNFDYDIVPDSIRSLISHLLEEISKTFKHLRPENYPATRLAMLMKVKLIEVMCRHRKREIEKLEKRSILYQALDTLTKECRKGTKEGKGVQKETKNSKDLRDTSGYIDTDSDVIFDDDIFNHVWFYVFEGFFNVKILTNFVYFTRISITSTIKFQNKTITGTSSFSPIYIKFWTDLHELLYGHNRTELLENTMLMTYTVADDDILEIFEDLWHVIKSISNIKFHHLNYIRHLKIYDTEDEYEFTPLYCLNIYNRIMSNIPLELSNEVVVLSGILEEACFRIDNRNNINDRYSLGDNISKISIPFSNKSCSDLCGVTQLFTKSLGKDEIPKKVPTSFQCYDGDNLSMTINMYKPTGKIVNDLSLNILKNLRPFYLLDYDFPYTEIIHNHDVAPSVPTVLDKSESLDQFLKLLILTKIKKEEEEIVLENVEFKNNLVTYDGAAFRNSLKVMPYDGDSNTEFPLDGTFNPNPMNYYWQEKYPSHVMLQELYKIQQEFAYMDSMYCSEIERLLVTFHDNLDDSGINTKIYDESICTPVCLRDFCRYTVLSAANWLNKNKPPTYVRKIEESEECPGTKKIRKMNIFPEYRYLLETNISDEKTSTGTAESAIQNIANDVTFDEMISDLENYPNNKRLIEECYKTEFQKDFLAYDFAGTKYFALRGARTIFASHDNVKITVENTKLIEENNKCTVNLKYMNNNLILHSHEMFKDCYAFHWHLEDDTIITFEIIKSKKRTTKVTEAESTTTEDDEEEDVVEAATEEEVDVVKMRVKTLDEENLKVILGSTDLQKKIEETTDVKEEDVEEEKLSKTVVGEKIAKDIFQSLNEAVINDLPVYKIHKNYETIKLKNPSGNIPMVNILERVLHNAGKKLCQNDFSGGSSSKKFVPTHTLMPPLTVQDAVSFRITLPNGIYLTCYPSQIREHLIEVKQEQLSTNITALKTEEFRLFTREGYVLIKKIDGTITLLMSNGNQIDFEKPDTNKEEIRNSPLKQFHCKSLNDYRKKLNEIMKKNGDGNPYYISRRAALETKKGYVINKDILKVLENSKVPYLKTTLLNFEGNKTVLSHNKITYKKLYYTVSENDFVKEEISFERKDGLKGVLERSGNNIVQFTDGTRISTSVGTAPELVDGYVFISLYYKYQHPYYATVAYGEDDLMQVYLNNDVVLEDTVNNIITLTMDRDVTTSIDGDSVRFVKKCPKCESQYTCLFNINPFHTNTLDFTGQFVHAEDSYGKHFFVDYAGNCKKNAYYKTGHVNVRQCNHHAKNVYKRLYCLKKTFSGEQFFTDDMVETLISEKETAENTTIVERKRSKKHQNLMLDINTKYYESYAERCLSKAVIRSEVALTKYKQIMLGKILTSQAQELVLNLYEYFELEKRNRGPLEPLFSVQEATSRPLYYSTNKFLMQILTTKSLMSLLRTMIGKLTENHVRFRLMSFLEAKDEEVALKTTESLERRKKLLAEEDKKCKCIKKKATFAGKILRWQDECSKFKKLIREKSCPYYFHSEFCQQLK